MDINILMQKVLGLAIKGKLVPQDPNDEPASVLLIRIREEKAKLVKEGLLKKKDIQNDTVIFLGDDGLHYEKFSDGTAKCIEKEIPFEIPENWEWCRLNDIIRVYSGQDLAPDEYNDKNEGIPYITGASNFKNGELIINRWTTSPRIHAKIDDLLLTVKGTVGEIAFCNIDDAHIARQIMALRCSPAIIPKYLHVIILAMLSDIVFQAKGIVPGIRREVILKNVVAVPPINEQRRIATCIESIQKRTFLIENDERIIKELSSLTKSKVLDLAIRGQLVLQYPTDEPASVLLERIRASKEKLIKGGKVKRDRKESVIYRRDNSYYEIVDGVESCIDEEISFKIPKSWELVRLSMICQLSDGEKKIGKLYPVMDVNFLRNKGEIVYKKSGKFVKEGTKLILVDGENSGEVFTAPKDGYMGSTFKVLWISAEVVEAYILKFIEFHRILLKNSKWGTAIPHLNRGMLFNLILPVPPVEEQKRIVSKIEKILSAIEKF